MSKKQVFDEEIAKLQKHRDVLSGQIKDLDIRLTVLREIRDDIEEELGPRLGSSPNKQPMFPRGLLGEKLLSILKRALMPLNSKDVAEVLAMEYPVETRDLTDREIEKSVSSGLAGVFLSDPSVYRERNGRYFEYRYNSFALPSASAPREEPRADDDGFVDPVSVLQDLEEGEK